MPSPVDRHADEPAAAAAMADPAVRADDRTRLAAQFAAICAEIRAYPTPIARCDEQLSGLIEERSRIAAVLARLDDSPTCSANPS